MIGGFCVIFGEAPRADVGIMAVVFVITVAVDLITAVGVGVVLASLLFVKEMADLQLANMKVITEVHEESPLTAEEAAVMERNAGKDCPDSCRWAHEFRVG